MSTDGETNPGLELLEYAHAQWIQPELDRRILANALPENFVIVSCLVRLPEGADPIVEFNNEITWSAKTELPAKPKMAVGDPVTISQVGTIHEVHPPEVGGVPVPFYFVCWMGDRWKLVYHIRNLHTDKETEWKFSKPITEFLNATLREQIIRYFDATHAKIETIALWPAPALITYPLGRITEHCEKDEFAEARALLVSYCDPAFLAGRVGDWNQVPSFQTRTPLFAEALAAHTDGKYFLSISTLIPQIEGVMTDWMYANLSADAIRHKQESKTKDLRKILLPGARRLLTDHRIAESVVEFMLDVVLGGFKNWLDPVSVNFPGRHVIGHGKFEPSMFTEENSIKVILLLDTLHVVLAAAKPETGKVEAT